MNDEQYEVAQRKHEAGILQVALSVATNDMTACEFAGRFIPAALDYCAANETPEFSRHWLAYSLIPVVFSQTEKQLREICDCPACELERIGLTNKGERAAENLRAETLLGMTGFVSNVQVMRDAQRDYFRTRERDALIISKAAEKRVDAYLQEWAGQDD